MSTIRPGQPGATRTCPHCRQTILESAVVCPGCKGHLRSGVAAKADARIAKTETALSVEGTIAHPATSSPWEYSVLVTVRDEKGRELSRHVASVGTFTGAVERSFTLAVEVFKPNS